MDKHDEWARELFERWLCTAPDSEEEGAVHAGLARLHRDREQLLAACKTLISVARSALSAAEKEIPFGSSGGIVEAIDKGQAAIAAAEEKTP